MGRADDRQRSSSTSRTRARAVARLAPAGTAALAPRQAVAALARIAGINIALDRALQRKNNDSDSDSDSSAEPRVTMTLSLRNVSVAGALRAICDWVGGNVDYAVDDGVVWIGRYLDATPTRPEVFDLRPVTTANGRARPAADFAPPANSGGVFWSPPPSDAEELEGILRATFLPPRIQLMTRFEPDIETRPWPLWRGRLIADDLPTRRRRMRRIFVALEATDAPATATAPAATQPTGDGPAGRAVEGEPDDMRKLDERRPELALDGMRFDKAVELIARAWDVNIVVDWSASRASIDNETPIHAHLRNIRLSQTLEILLQQAAMPPGNHPSYRMEDGVITIASADRLGTVGIMKVYDVRDLVDDAVAYGHPLPPATQPDSDGAAAPPPPAGLPAEPRTAEEAEGMNLRELVKSSLANGGTGQLEYWSGRLIVIDTGSAHRRIETLLRELRQTRKHHPQTMPSGGHSN